jgi:hypothetical protein
MTDDGTLSAEDCYIDALTRTDALKAPYTGTILYIH